MSSNAHASSGGSVRRWTAFGAGLVLALSLVIVSLRFFKPDKPQPGRSDEPKPGSRKVVVAPSAEADAARDAAAGKSNPWPQAYYPDDGLPRYRRPWQWLYNRDGRVTNEAIELLKLNEDEVALLQEEVNRWRDRMTELVKANLRPLDFDPTTGCVGRFYLRPFESAGKKEVDAFLYRTNIALNGKAMDKLPLMVPVLQYAGLGSLSGEFRFHEPPANIATQELLYDYELKNPKTGHESHSGKNAPMQDFQARFGNVLNLETTSISQVKNSMIAKPAGE